MHRSLALLTLIFCALLSQPLFAIEKIKLKPVVVVNAQSAKPAKWARARAYWYEETIKNNIRHYKVKFLFQVSNKMAFEDIDSDSPESDTDFLDAEPQLVSISVAAIDRTSANGLIVIVRLLNFLSSY